MWKGKKEGKKEVSSCWVSAGESRSHGAGRSVHGRAGEPRQLSVTRVLQALALFWLCIQDCCGILSSCPP